MLDFGKWLFKDVYCEKHAHYLLVVGGDKVWESTGWNHVLLIEIEDVAIKNLDFKCSEHVLLLNVAIKNLDLKSSKNVLLIDVVIKNMDFKSSEQRRLMSSIFSCNGNSFKSKSKDEDYLLKFGWRVTWKRLGGNMCRWLVVWGRQEWRNLTK